MSRGRAASRGPGGGREPGERGREGCGRGGASPGRSCGPGARRGRGSEARASAGRWHPLAQTVCPQRRLRPGSPGESQGRGRKRRLGGPRRAGAGPSWEGGGGAATFEVETVVGPARRLWSPCPAARISADLFGRVQFRESHVFKFLRVRDLSELQSATKGRRTRRLAAGAEPGRLPRGARAPSPPRAHRLVLSLSRPSPGSDGGGRGRLRRSVCRGPEMGGGECFYSAPFRTSLRASRGEGDPGRSALQPPPGPSRARGSRLVRVRSVGGNFSSSSIF